MSSTLSNSKKTVLPQFAKQIKNDKLEVVFECIICKSVWKSIPLFQRHLTEEKHLNTLESIRQAAQNKKQAQLESLKRQPLLDQEDLAVKLRQEEEEELKKIEEQERQEALIRMEEFRKLKYEVQKELEESVKIQEQQLQQKEINNNNNINEESESESSENNEDNENIQLKLDQKQNAEDQGEEGEEGEEKVVEKNTETEEGDQVEKVELEQFKKDIQNDGDDDYEYQSARSLIDRLKNRKKLKKQSDS